MSLDQVPHLATVRTTHQPILSLVLAREGPAAVVAVRGPLDLDTVDLLLDFVEELMAGQPPPVLVLDLSEVTFFSAAGISALLTVRRRAASDGCALLVRNPSRITATVLGLVGLADEFTIAYPGGLWG
ncbi:MAG: STAS domain-containing protein [Micromonospora sp.]